MDEVYCHHLRGKLASLAIDYAENGILVPLDSLGSPAAPASQEQTVAPDIQPSQTSDPISVTITAELMQRAMEMLQRNCNYTYDDLYDVLVNESGYLPEHAQIIVDFFKDTGYVSHSWF